MSHMPVQHGRQQQFQRGSVAGIPFAPSPSDMGGMPPPPPFHHDMLDPEMGESKQSPDKQGYGNRGPGHTSHAMPPFYTPGATSNAFQPTPPSGPPRGPGNSGAGLPDNSGSGMGARGRLPPLRGAGDGRRLSGASAASDSGGGRARRGSNASGTFQQQVCARTCVSACACVVSAHVPRANSGTWSWVLADSPGGLACVRETGACETAACGHRPTLWTAWHNSSPARTPTHAGAMAVAGGHRRNCCDLLCHSGLRCS